MKRTLFIILPLIIWHCSFLGERDRGDFIAVEFDLQKDGGVFEGMGANVPISYYNRRMKPLQTLNDLDVKYIRVKRESDNWDNILALRSASGRLGIKWIYSLDAIPVSFLNEFGQLIDIEGFADWWAEEVDELYYQEVPADFIELLDSPDLFRGDSISMNADTYNALIYATREQLDLRGYEQVGIVGPGLSTPETSGELETWYMDLDQAAFDELDYWTVQLWEDRFASGNLDAALNQYSEFLNNIDSWKPTFVSAYATSKFVYGELRYPNPSQYDIDGNLNSFETYYYSASFSLPYGLRVYSNTLDILKYPQSTPFIYQLYDAPADVKFKKKSWGLLDLNGVPKPAFALLSSLTKRIPKKAKIIPAKYEPVKGLNALGFSNHERIILTLANEELESRSIQVVLKGADRSLEFIRGTTQFSSVIHPVELGKRDVVESQELALKIRSDSESDGYVFSITLNPQSTLISEFQLK